jgi:protein phosphatase
MDTEGAGASTPSTSGPNEDAYLVHDGLGLYVVADGASGGPAGEVAARIAVSALESFVRDAGTESPAYLFDSFPSESAALDAILFAMGEVVSAAEASEVYDGMATTVTMLLAYEDKAVACHVGDSRLYLIRDCELHQLTADHDITLSPRGRSAEVYANVPIDCFGVDLREADTFLLCTDGAEEVIGDPTVLSGMWNRDLRAIASRIVAAARRVNPERDATAVVVRVLEDADGWLMISEPTSAWVYGNTLEYAGSPV